MTLMIRRPPANLARRATGPLKVRMRGVPTLVVAPPRTGTVRRHCRDADTITVCRARVHHEEVQAPGGRVL